MVRSSKMIYNRDVIAEDFMTTKEKLISEIDHLPEEILGEILKFIKSLKKKTFAGKCPRNFKLKGQFDDTDLRKRAYE